MKLLQRDRKQKSSKPASKQMEVSLKVRLISYFLVVALLVGVVGYSGIKTINNVGNEFYKFSTETTPKLQALSDLRFNGIKIVAATKGRIAAAEAEIEQEEKEIKEAREQYNKAFKIYEDLIYRFFPEEKEILENIRVTGEKLKKTSSDIIVFKTVGLPEGQVLEAKGFEKSAKEFLLAINAVIKFENNEIAERAEEAESALASSKSLILIVVVIAILFSIALGLFVSYRITKPLEELSRTVDEVSKGNFKFEVKKTSGIKEINVLADSLGRVMTTMKFAVDEKGPIEVRPDKKPEEDADKRAEEGMEEGPKKKFMDILKLFRKE